MTDGQIVPRETPTLGTPAWVEHQREIWLACVILRGGVGAGLWFDDLTRGRMLGSSGFQHAMSEALRRAGVKE